MLIFYPQTNSRRRKKKRPGRLLKKRLLNRASRDGGRRSGLLNHSGTGSVSILKARLCVYAEDTSVTGSPETSMLSLSPSVRRVVRDWQHLGTHRVVQPRLQKPSGGRRFGTMDTENKSTFVFLCSLSRKSFQLWYGKQQRYDIALLLSWRHRCAV